MKKGFWRLDAKLIRCEDMTPRKTANQRLYCRYCDQSEAWELLLLSEMLDQDWSGAVEHQLLSWDTQAANINIKNFTLATVD